MKQLLSLSLLTVFLSFAIPLDMAAQVIQTDWYTSHSGDGPYTISRAEELAGLAELVNNGNSFAGKTIILGNDIDLTGWLKAEDADGPVGGGNNGSKGWDPIGFTGASMSYFQGTFEGNGHTIKGLWINREDRTVNTALFGCVGSNATIRNLMLTIDTGKGGVKGKNQVGGLVGWNEGRITGCAVLPMVAGSTEAMVTGTGAIGGLVGFNYNSISYCYVTGKVTGIPAGGLAGNNLGPITASFFDITTTGQTAVTGRGIGLTTEEMKTIASYTTYAPDFTTIWNIDPTGVFNNGYPYLRSQASMITLAVSANDFFTYAVGVTTVTEGNNTFIVPTDGNFTFSFAPKAGYTAANAVVTATGINGGTSTLTSPAGDGLYTLTAIRCDSTITITGIQSEQGEQGGQPFHHTVTLTADPGIVLLPSAGTHAATIGGSFTFYVTLAPGFEGRTPQATVNGDPVTLTLRPNGTEWMYTIPQVYDDARVIVSFATTANEGIDAPQLYCRNGQLFVETAQPLMLTVHSVTGQTVVSRRVAEGLTAIQLPEGVYIVKLNNKITKAIVRH